PPLPVGFGGMEAIIAGSEPSPPERHLSGPGSLAAARLLARLVALQRQDVATTADGGRSPAGTLRRREGIGARGARLGRTLAAAASHAGGRVEIRRQTWQSTCASRRYAKRRTGGWRRPCEGTRTRWTGCWRRATRSPMPQRR